MALSSMTGFADLAGRCDGFSWIWEVRSVNGRGLDIRARLPEGFEGLEPRIRAGIARIAQRGSVTVGLRLSRGAGSATPKINSDALEAAIQAAEVVGEAAARLGLGLAPMTAADLLGVRGVLETEVAQPSDNIAVLAALAGEIDDLAERLGAARAAEGRELARLITTQIDRVADLVRAARASAEARAARTGSLLRTRIDAVLASTALVDEGRLAQELALIAVKSDVTEELDRLEAHVAAARKFLDGTGPVGRKLDFLIQEFNREANTLCAKAGATDLTAIGLELKVVIDQMREQVQNVE